MQEASLRWEGIESQRLEILKCVSCQQAEFNCLPFGQGSLFLGRLYYQRQKGFIDHKAAGSSWGSLCIALLTQLINDNQNYQVLSMPWSLGSYDSIIRLAHVWHAIIKIISIVKKNRPDRRSLKGLSKSNLCKVLKLGFGPRSTHFVPQVFTLCLTGSPTSVFLLFSACRLDIMACFIIKTYF